jgi:hypothetical protein
VADVTGICEGVIGPVSGAGDGVVGAVGTGAGSIPSFNGAASGTVGIVGEGAGVISSFVGDGVGGYNTGTSAGTISRLTGNGTGNIGSKATGAGVISSFVGGTVAAKIPLRFQSRPVYPGPQESSFAEAIDAVVFCEFRDIEDFTMRITSDKYRQYSEAEYNTNDTVECNHAVAGQPHFRNFVRDIPPEGLYGSFFQYKFEKICPITGDFKYFGFDMHIVGRPELGAEFNMTSGALTNAWPT